LAQDSPSACSLPCPLQATTKAQSSFRAMGAGAGAVGAAKGADADAISAGVEALSAKDKAILFAAIEANAGGDSIAVNAKNIANNEGDIHELYITVMSNKQAVFEARSMIEENRSSVIQNYTAAFMGNRQMANENTDAIYKNRFTILEALKVDGLVQENFRQSKINESTIEYLENRCQLNNRVAKVNEKFSDANAAFIEVNGMVLATNEEIVTFNAAQIATNCKLLEGIQADKATPEANAARIAANAEKVANIKNTNLFTETDLVTMHAEIKKNRIALEANAATIKERRKEILANRTAIKENGAKVGALLRTSQVNIEEITASLGSLSDDEKANLKIALQASGEGSDEMWTNKKNIRENEAQLHGLHMEVLTNKTKLYKVRAIIEENRALLLKNYASAFTGNRQIGNQNTDDLFKNRRTALKGLKVDGQVQENFRQSKINEANVDFLEHRALMNKRVAQTNLKMTEANAKLIEINSMIMSSNAEIVKFNAAAIETNTKLLEGIQADKATPESNAARIEKNTKDMQMIIDHVASYDEKVDKMLMGATENRENIINNAGDIEERGQAIWDNRAGIIENSTKVMGALRA